MNHEECKVLVSAYHDGEVTAEERAQVEAHLAECAECTETLAAYGRMGRTVHNLPRGAPSRELWLRVQQGIAPRRRSLWQRLLPVVPALALVAIGITLFIVLGGLPGGLGPAAPALQRQAASPEMQQPLLAPSAASPAPQPTAASLPFPGAVTCSVNLTVTPPCADEYSLTSGAGAAACPGAPLALEMVTVSVRSDTARTAPLLRGVLYDTAGKGLPDVTLVISGTAGWQGTVVTAADGSFALDLPERGTYRVVLALSPTAAKAQVTAEDTATNSYQLPDGAVCQGPRDMALAPLVLDAHDEAIVTLRVH
jgi:hypothetical protein